MSNKVGAEAPDNGEHDDDNVDSYLGCVGPLVGLALGVAIVVIVGLLLGW